MSSEYELFERGYAAILAALARDGGEMNVDVLAQACSRKACAPGASQAESLGWAEAAVACYAEAARHRPAGIDRQGSEYPAFGLMGLMILRWGPEVGSKVQDPTRIVDWIQTKMDAVGDLKAFQARLADSGADREQAICLRERLQVAVPLQARRLVPPSIVPWLRCAGLLSVG